MSKPSQVVTKHASSAQNYHPNPFEGMLGVSLPMLEVFQSIIDAASADVFVSTTGQTGTGKASLPARFTIEAEEKTIPL